MTRGPGGRAPCRGWRNFGPADSAAGRGVAPVARISSRRVVAVELFQGISTGGMPQFRTTTSGLSTGRPAAARGYTQPVAEYGTLRVKTGLAEMLKGGVIMDVVDADPAPLAPAARASAR